MDAHPFDIEHIVSLCMRGDQEAFQRLFSHLQGRVFSYVVSRVATREEAQDVTQDIFVDLWHTLQKNFEYKGESAFLGFVFLIAKRRIIKHYRSHKETIPFDEQTMGGIYEMKYEDIDLVYMLVEKLQPKFQEVIRLRYWTGLPFKEIAIIMNSKEATVKVWHHRAIKMLDSLVKKYGK